MTGHVANAFSIIPGRSEVLSGSPTRSIVTDMLLPMGTSWWACVT